MKSYNNLYEKILDRETLEKCFRDAARKKTRRRDVRRILDNLDEHIDILYGILEREEFIPSYHEANIIQETSCRKARRIVKPNYQYEQVVHHAAIKQFSQIVTAGLYEQVCGSIKGRGTHGASKTVEKWIREYDGKKFYILKTDIRHFFESIDREILKAKLKKVIRDKRFLRLMYILIEYDRIGEVVHYMAKGRKPLKMCDKKDLATEIAFGRTERAIKIIEKYNPDPETMQKTTRTIISKRTGVPLGYYTSQWNGNFYLKDLDHYIVQVLRPDHYMRYMDDMIFISRNKRSLKKIREKVARYMKDELRLEMKSNWQIFRFEYVGKDGRIRGRMLDFLGFQFHYDRKTLRKSILKRIRRKALRIGAKKGQKISWYEASQMLSYMGTIQAADVYGFYERNIKDQIQVKRLKKIVSKHTRRENAKKEDHLQKSGKPGISDPC